MGEIRSIAPESRMIQKARAKIEEELKNLEVQDEHVKRAVETIRRQRERHASHRVPLSKKVYHPIEEPSLKIQKMIRELSI